MMKGTILPPAAAAALLLGACVTVPSGYRAVVVGPRGRARILAEGVSVVAPLSQASLYDVRRLQASEDLTALTSDGAPVAAGSSVVTYRVPPEELTALDRETGPAYYRTLLRPILLSVTRRVLARYRWRDLLDSANVLRAQNALAAEAAGRLRPRHVVLDSVIIRGIFIDLPKTSAAITDTGVWEQRVLQEREELLVAARRSEALRRAAAGAADANERIGPTLTSAILADADRRAWGRLLRSRAARVVAATDGSKPVVEVEP